MVRIKKGFPGKNLKTLDITGTGGRDRTDMGLPPRDFESRASTNFTTPALWSFVASITLGNAGHYRTGHLLVSRF